MYHKVAEFIVRYSNVKKNNNKRIRLKGIMALNNQTMMELRLFLVLASKHYHTSEKVYTHKLKVIG